MQETYKGCDIVYREFNEDFEATIDRGGMCLAPISP